MVGVVVQQHLNSHSLLTPCADKTELAIMQLLRLGSGLAWCAWARRSCSKPWIHTLPTPPTWLGRGVQKHVLLLLANHSFFSCLDSELWLNLITVHLNKSASKKHGLNMFLLTQFISPDNSTNHRYPKCNWKLLNSSSKPCIKEEGEKCTSPKFPASQECTAKPWFSTT